MRLGTVNAATVPPLAPAVRQFRQTHPQTQVEVITAQQAEIHQGVLEGSLELDLVNYLDGDDLPPGTCTESSSSGPGWLDSRPYPADLA